MPKFYLVIIDDAVLEDDEGTDLPDLDMAWEHAQAVAHELIYHRDSMLGQPWSDWKMLVRNEKGEEVFSFPMGKRP